MSTQSETCSLCKQNLSKNEFIICSKCRNNYSLDDSENNFLDLFLKNSLQKYQPHERAICMSFSTEAVIGSVRQILNKIIIECYKNSQQPLDILAVALTYARMHAAERPLAIQYFENYLKNPVCPPKIFHIAYEDYSFSKGRDTYSFWHIYSTFANIYEKEYMFEKAIYCLKNCIKTDNKTNPTDYIRIGNNLIKIGIDQAEQYYIRLLSDESLMRYKRQFAIALDDVLIKKAKGYIYKPRKKASN